LSKVLHGPEKKHRVLKKCADCGILFLTHPGNRNRKDILCPFGCRIERRRKKGNIRVKDYYGSPEGIVKKKKINKKRYLNSNGNSTGDKVTTEGSEDEDFLNYMSWMVGLTEGRKISKEELKACMDELETTPPGQNGGSG
jgi:hypothetical protein